MKKEIKLSVRKADVYDKVSQTSEYIGAKSDNEQDYEKITAIDDDGDLLESFWSEASVMATNTLKPFFKSVSNMNDGIGLSIEENFEATLSMPENFDETLVPSINSSLTNYFSAYIKSKWFEIVKPDSVETYANTASAFLDDVKNKMYYRKRPTRR